jgi:hypothetical protein
MANTKESSRREATKASKTLSNPNASALDKSLAGSVLSQARGGSHSHGGSRKK